MSTKRVNRTGLLAVILAFCMLISGCGKEKEEETLPPPSLPADMVFEPVNQTVTAKDETNLRDYPGQGDLSTVLFTLQNGETAQRTGISESGWSQLEYRGRICYAVSSFLTTDLDYKPDTADGDRDGIQTEFQQVRKTLTAKDTVNLRSLPSITSPDVEIIGTLKNGDTADCVGISESGWAKLSYNGQICYAVYSYLTDDLNYTPSQAPQNPDGIRTEFEPASGTVTAKDAVNLRSIPSVTDGESRILAKLHKGDTAERLGISDNGWTKLRYNGDTCYAVTSYLIVVGEEAEEDSGEDGEIKTRFTEVNEQVTAKVEVNLRTVPSVTDPRSQIIKNLKNGEIVTRTGINEDLGWSRVEYDGQVLYCVSSYLTRLKN